MIMLYFTRNARDPKPGILNRLHRAWRRIVFFVGDIHLMHTFPYITWDNSGPQMDYKEAMDALRHIRAGDIGLHRDWGYLSNVAIPGFMKHAWIHINEPQTNGIHDISNMNIVEAVSEGVLKRSALHPLISEYVIILRPKGMNEIDIKHAVSKAEKIVGCNYDADFKFDIEQELEHFNETNLKNLAAEWDGGFSCTEAVSFAWWHKHEELGLYRVHTRGKDVILADNMLNRNFEIIWMSKTITPEIAASYGMPEEGVQIIKDYRDKNIN